MLSQVSIVRCVLAAWQTRCRVDNNATIEGIVIGDIFFAMCVVEIRRCSSQYSARLSVHSNNLVANLMAQPDNRRLRRQCQMIWLPDS
jgi:hypothetical protein